MGAQLTQAPKLLGRQREREALDRLLEAARGGRGGVLVVHGEAGVGKTALLEGAVQAAHEFRALRTVGVEGETELPYAALQQLCSPILELAQHLPDPQRNALEVAFGISVGEAPSPFLVGLAVLGLLSEAANKRPLLCVVDDAHWLDRESARALAFVARRLLAEKLALLFAARTVGDALAGLPELQVRPLGHREARALLESVLASPLDEQVLERIVVETRGNPLALLELPRGLTAAQLAGGFGLPAAMPVWERIEEGFTKRLSRQPPDVRRFLLLAAADPAGDSALVWRAARQLGVPEPAARTAESEGFLALEAGVAFRHPLVRSAVYRAAGPVERAEAHQALAAATDPQIDPDRRAWHRAQAASGPDAEIAAELERSAARAQARGGFAAAAAFLERAAALTPEPVVRARRALAAAQTKFQAGALDDALGLLGTVDAATFSELQAASADLLRAQIAFVSTRGSEAPALLLQAARRLSPVDPIVARKTYLEAVSAALFAGRLAGPGGRAQDVARDARAAPQPDRSGVSDLLLDGLVALLSENYEAAAPRIRQAQDACTRDVPSAEQLHWLWLGSVACLHLWDDAGWEELSRRHVRLARETGALAELPLALSQRTFTHLLAGDLTVAASLVDEIQAAAEATGGKITPYGAVGLAALRGLEAEAVYLIVRTRADVIQRGEGVGISVLDWAEAVLYNGLGRYEAARTAALRVAEYEHDLGTSNWGLVELIEASVRAGTPEVAAEARERLLQRTIAAGTEWALGVAARCEALLAADDNAEELYVEAITRLGRCRMAVDLARAHLLYGEWLRRQRRRLEARQQLRTAHELFSNFRLEAFAERARVELQATGEHARKRTFATQDQLTPQEAQISRLAAEGQTNREIAAQLFISPSTVEYHLRKAFRKLDVRSRTQLSRRLG